VGHTKTLPVSLTNTGPGKVTVSKMAKNAPAFSVGNLKLPLTLATGQSVRFNISFTPQINKHVDGYLAFTSNAANIILDVYVHGTGVMAGSLVANPSSVSFGRVQVGSSKTLYQTLKNTSSSTLTISQASITGSGFSLRSLNLPLNLTGGQSVTFGVVFAPRSSGSASGTISVASNASNPILKVSLSADGTSGGSGGQLTVAATTLNFGGVAVGQGRSLTGTLRAAGASVTVSSATSNSSEFTLSGMSFPLKIAAGQNVSFTANFKPQTSGTALGKFYFASNAANSPTIETLTGTGTTALPHSVTLSWKPSTSAVVGYNVYRSETSAGPYKRINSVLHANTIYIDNSVQGGKTYYYATTSVSGKGIESNYSNQVKAVIPYP